MLFERALVIAMIPEEEIGDDARRTHYFEALADRIAKQTAAR